MFDTLSKGDNDVRYAFELSKAGKYLGQAAKMMIGVPDYDNYVEHMRITHPDQTPMTYEEFFRERQDARYGGKGGARCC
ncbi:putative small protein YjiX [Salmonella enterica subsp. enterica serovar Minnesota str. A4-603]|nr:putative small protein YjiX [Salmonella enterica subsp. enterica serovar Minnesota str. A4-603]